MKIFRLNKCRDERGNALVETALSATILLGLIFGSLEMFWALYSYHYVSYVAREASRWAMVRGSQCQYDTSSSSAMECNAQGADIQTFVQGLNYPGINSNNITVTASWATPSASRPTTWTTCNNQCDDPGNTVTVDVTYAFPLNLPFFQSATLNMSSTSSVVITQ